MEILLHKSPFDIAERCLKEEILEKRKKEKYKRNEDIRKNNKSRITHEFKKNEYVYVRNYHPDKILDKWLGPYLITKIYDNNTIDIMKNDKIKRVSIKNTKPCWGEGRMSCLDDCFKNMPKIDVQKFLEILKYKYFK
ncbi:hypothetical protein EQH57_1055, partial [Dictyocoela roeselum]